MNIAYHFVSNHISIVMTDLWKDLITDDEYILNRMREGKWKTIKHASMKLRDDHSFMIKAIRLNRYALDYASDRLKSDKTFALEAMDYAAENVQYLPRTILKDPDIMKKVMLMKDSIVPSRYLFRFEQDLDYDTLSAAIELRGDLLLYIPRSLRTKKIVEAAKRSIYKPDPEDIPDEFK
jgi:hypothetical protein